MATPETITSKLHAEADAELKAEISALLAGAKQLRNVTPTTISIHTAWKDNDPKVAIFPLAAINAIEDAAFEAQRDKRRTAHINTFLQRITALESQVEELAHYRE